MTSLTESKLKALMNSGFSESEIRQAYSEEENQPSRMVTDPEELRAFGINTEGELIISCSQPGRKSCP